MQTFTSLEYLKIDVASNFGLDKAKWKDRLAWFDQHEDVLETLTKKADKPALYHAGVQAYRQAKQGKPIGYPISLDATASGLQLLSIMAGCRKSAERCNVVVPLGSNGEPVDDPERENAYTYVYDRMTAKLNTTSTIGYDPVKQAIMTALYSSKAVPRDTFGEGTDLLACFYDTMQEVLPGAWSLNEALLGTWQPTALEHSWVLPDNFHVKVKVKAVSKYHANFLGNPVEVFITENRPVEEGRSNPANLTHSLDGMVARELTNRCMFNVKDNLAVVMALDSAGTSRTREKDQMVLTLWEHYRKSGFLSTRILAYLDKHNMGLVSSDVIASMIESFPERPFKILSIHDCFRVHPNYGNDLRRQYNQILSDLARSNILKFCVEQIVGHPVTVQKDKCFANEVLNAEYALS